jgi:hypothetical protein
MRQLLLLFILTFFQWSATAGQIELRGTYQGENLYVKNPFSVTGVGFCVYEVTVNGMTTTDEINSTAFEIDLAVFGFTLGEQVVVSINYKEGCLPRVLNADVLNAKASFEIEEFKMQGNNVVWKTRNETGALPFIVEQFRWNKWVAVGQVDGVGVEGVHAYSAPVRLHAGENRFRIRQTDSRKSSKVSAELVHNSSKEPVNFAIVSGNGPIEFSSPTMYELYDSYGRIVVKGYGKSLKIDELEKGWYYLNYDNQLDMFRK